jgi:FAD-dependent urate hydroxylase
VVGVESIDRGPVARFADGTSKSYDLVVGADGVRSVVRRALYPEAEATPTGLYYFRFLSRAWSATPADVWRSVERSDAAFGHIPVGEGLLHCFVQLRRATTPCAAGEEDEYFRAVPCGWDETLAQAYDRRCGVLRAGPAQIVNPIRWGRGACVLLGDASHALSPTLSEGGSLALEDAIVFAGALRHAADLSAVVERYADARRQRVEWAHRMAMSQLAAVARGRTQALPRRQSAIDYMTQLYRPLCGDLSPAWPLGPGPRYHP